jgi:membrane-associated protease RseP (regulator of RpoE activity)
MTILICHEAGHYLVARRHGVDVSLPYFIPMPPGISLGTLGAVIRMRSPIVDRNQLIDVGAAGPLAGLVVAIPLLILGLSLSPVTHASIPGGVIEGNSLLYLALKWLVTGQILPAADGTDVQLHPVAFAAWVGLLITMINLIPIGQLDGGHVACAFLGDRHEALSARLHLVLVAVGIGVTIALAGDAVAVGLPSGEAMTYGLQSSAPWFVWAILLLVMRRLAGGVYHPPVGATPLTRERRRLVFFMVIVFLSIFTPVPLRHSLP